MTLDVVSATQKKPNSILSISAGVSRFPPNLPSRAQIMDDFWTRPAGAYSKPVWIRPGTLQLVFDDDNTGIRKLQHKNLPGGSAAFSRTATVYSEKELTPADFEMESKDPIVKACRSKVFAFTQRVGSVYLVEANILGFASEVTGLEEQTVLSSAVKWALADYTCRNGEPPEQIVLHVDVNGTLALGDQAGSKSFAKMASSLAADILKRAQGGDSGLTLPDKTREAISRVAQAGNSEDLHAEFTVNYSGNDFIRATVACLGALAPAAVRDIDDELSGSFTGSCSTKSRDKSFAAAFEIENIEKPALTVAIRTNGTEHRQAVRSWRIHAQYAFLPSHFLALFSSSLLSTRPCTCSA